jgi:hypothetical protein
VAPLVFGPDDGRVVELTEADRGGRAVPARRWTRGLAVAGENDILEVDGDLDDAFAPYG